MFGTKKLGNRLAAWFENRRTAYHQAANTTGVDVKTQERMAICALVLGEVAAGIREVTGAATAEEMGEESPAKVG